MKRRDFITLIGGAVAAWPLGARAQKPRMPVIGLLGTTSREADARLAPFRQALQQAGYVEKQNVAIEYRWAENEYDRFPALAADLVQRQVTVIVSLGGTPGALAAKTATSTIPIVFQAGVDPIQAGIVASLNRPGGNITGVSQLLTATVPKQLQLIHEVTPGKNIAFLLNQTNPLYSGSFLKDLEAAASTLGAKLHFLHASTENDFDPAFETLERLEAGALVVGPDLFFSVAAIGSLRWLRAIPYLRSIHGARRQMTEGLMSYGSSQADTYRQVAIYTARVLKGDNPADLPVQQSIKVELVLNLKTAKALGITFPLPLLGRADEVIE